MNEIVFNKATLKAADLPPYAGIAPERIVLVTSTALADEALEALTACDAVGFDTESKPTFLKGEASTGPHLIQLSTDSRAYLFPISPTDLKRETGVLKAILESSRLLKVGFGLGNDRSALLARLDIELNNVLDLGEALRGGGQLGQPDNQKHRGTVGTKLAVAHFFGARLQKSKKIGTSNWASRRLSAKQLLYAANDAYVALTVYRAWIARQQSQPVLAESLRQR